MVAGVKHYLHTYRPRSPSIESWLAPIEISFDGCFAHSWNTNAASIFNAAIPYLKLNKPHWKASQTFAHFAWISVSWNCDPDRPEYVLFEGVVAREGDEGAEGDPDSVKHLRRSVHPNLEYKHNTNISWWLM